MMTHATREKLLGCAHVAVSTAGLAVGGLLCLGIAHSEDPNRETALALVLCVFAVAQLLWLLPGLIGGLGLVWGQGWARGVIGVVSAILLFLFPAGTALGAAGLWLLFGKAAKAQVRAPTRLLGRGQGFLLAAVGAAGGLSLTVGLGYVFRDFMETVPRPSASPGLVAAVVGVAALMLLIFIAWSVRTNFHPMLMPPITLRQIKARAEQKRAVADHKARLARFAADPMRAQYAAMMAAGDYWTDEQIAYDLDPDRTGTCEHLVPIERTMRSDGIMLKPTQSPLHVDARCIIDAVRFEAILTAPFVSYDGDHVIIERFGDLIPAPRVICTQCNSGLHTEAPATAKPGTPAFP